MSDYTSDVRLALLLGLGQVNGIGPAAVREVIGCAGPSADPVEIRERIKASWSLKRPARELVLAALGKDAWSEYQDKGNRLLSRCQELDIWVVPSDAPGYPPWLRLIGDAPAVLYAKGALSDDRRTVAGVGTRQPSEFGIRAARGVTTSLADNGWTIVSGLAKGIDTIAHRAAMEARARTIAILGNGLDRVYPTENRELADEIVDLGGLLLSEQPPGVGPFPGNLVKRDRLQSGMSVATAVFETAVDGGAMHTAGFAKKQGRLVVVPVPSGRFAQLPGCGGNRMLLEGGAYGVDDRDQYEELDATVTRLLAGLESRSREPVLTTPRPTVQRKLDL